MKCHISIPKTLGLLLLCVLLLTASFFCTTLPRPKAQIFGWIGVVFCGLGFVVFAARLFQRGAAVVLDEAGILDVRSSFGLIPWAEITSLRTATVHSTRFLCVEVRDPGKYLARLPVHKRMLAGASPSLGLPPITFGFAGLSPGIEEVWAYVRRMHPELVAAPQ